VGRHGFKGVRMESRTSAPIRTHINDPALSREGGGDPKATLGVPLTRLDNSDPELMEELLEAVARVARSAAFTLGDELDAFESEFADYCDCGYAVGVSSGTDALALCLRAMDIGPGDEVIVPANSFIATAEAVSLVGATPRFVDVEAETQLLTAETVEPALGPRVRAIIPVHLFGRTVEMEPLVQLAREHSLRLLEDASQAHGATYRGRRVGSLGDCGCFSLYPSKNLGAWGDAGAVTTSDPVLARRIRLLRSHGEEPRYFHHEPGTTARLDTVQAAILRIKLRLLDAANDARRDRSARLSSALKDWVVVPSPPKPSCDHVYHQYVVSTPNRDSLRSHLAAHGIASAIHYPVPIHRTDAYSDPAQQRLPVAERLAETICSLPLYPAMTEGELTAVIDACRSFKPEV
jgi:dTDP-3-amino-3,4,6-trideoxy-alpha-D-glucose transaminase